MRRKKWMQLAALVAAGTMIISGCGISAGADSATTQAAARQNRRRQAKQQRAQMRRPRQMTELWSSKSREYFLLAARRSLPTVPLTRKTSGKRAEPDRRPMWTTQMYSIRSRRMRQNFRWCSYTVTDSPEWAG